MAFLQLASVVVPILSDSAEQPESEVGGAEVRAYAGNLRSTRRWSKRSWRFVSGRMTFAEESTLLTAIGTPDGGNVVACTGTFANGASIQCLVTVTNRQFVKMSSTVVNRRLTLLLKEV